MKDEIKQIGKLLVIIRNKLLCKLNSFQMWLKILKAECFAFSILLPVVTCLKFNLDYGILVFCGCFAIFALYYYGVESIGLEVINGKSIFKKGYKW